MGSDSTEIKLKIINHLLNQLHGYYSQCHQKYTENPSHKADYEKAYTEGSAYLTFIEEIFATWIKTPEAASVKNRYENCLNYAKLYLFTTCKPPHPSARSEHLTSNSDP